ncbi:CHAT domain-containing protein [Streptomyces sp. R35]|uniref:CHAT domain-containing protein n=1 Tax=Streptomyces sp. R35 TaxID=3238630 RepID=A0AB39RW38_9ACTN
MEYYVTEKRTLVFGLTGGALEPEVVSVDLNRMELRKLAGGPGDDLPDAEVFTDGRLSELVAPVERWACPGDIVYLVPHDALHRLPLAAIPLGGRPLIDRNPVAVTPSSSVLRYCRAKRTGRRGSALVVAAPPTERPLAFAQEQAYAVAAGFGQSVVLNGPAARRAVLLERLCPGAAAPDIVHFTTHGVFEPEAPMQSGIELADGRLTAQDILGLTLQVDLVTLGACSTGVSDRRPGDELMGLTRALLYAGAPSVLVTLWDVDEVSTSMLFTRFYAELAAGASKAECLRRAQQWLRRQTLADVLTYAQLAGERLRDDQVAETALLCEQARLHARAGDPACAERLLTGILKRRDLPEHLRDQVQIALLQMRLLGSGAVDGSPALLPFDDPYYWAPFLLVGDWL